MTPPTLEAELARLQHEALSWQDEATRLNRLVHALRRELEHARRMTLAVEVRALLATLVECLPVVLAEEAIATERRRHLVERIAVVEGLARRALERVG